MKGTGINLKKYDCTGFLEDLKFWEIELDDRQKEAFILYFELLTEWNSFMNLTAITDFEEVMKKHFTDSISLICALPNIRKEAYSLIDVGTGAGFPGIPLKIVFPQLKITLLDSLNKRVQFLNEVIKKLNLQETEAIHGRAEDFAKPGKLRESFDFCVSRAVANLATLSEYCLPFVKVGGFFVSYKSEKITEEYENAKEAIRVLGGKFEKQKEFYLPNSEIYRNLFVIRKQQETPGKFPRKAGTASKEPIQSRTKKCQTML